MKTKQNDVFIKACNVRDSLRDQLNGREGRWTDVLHQNKKLVADYIKADRCVRVWEEVLSLPETFNDC